MNGYPDKKMQKNISKILTVGTFTSFMLILTGILSTYTIRKTTFLGIAGIYTLLLTPVFRLFAVSFGRYKQKKTSHILLPLISILVLIILFVINH